MRGSVGLIRARMLTTSACAMTVAVIATGLAAQVSRAAGSPTAREAGKVYLVENAQLHLAHNNEYESTLGERGQATGTFDAAVTAALALVPSHVTATFAIYPHGGSIKGTAHANYIVKGSVGYFGGTLTIIGGTGTYRHASGTNVGFSGTIDRQNFSMSIKVHGWVTL